MHKVYTRADLDNFLTKPEKVKIFDIAPFLKTIEKEDIKIIKKEGVYLKGMFRPWIQFYKHHYFLGDNEYRVITSFEDILENKSGVYIYSEKHKCFLKMLTLKKIKSLEAQLVVNPKVDYNTLKFIERLMRYLIDLNLEYEPYDKYNNYQRLLGLLEEESVDFIENEIYEKYLFSFMSDIYEEMVEFHENNLFTVDILNSGVIVKRMGDFRAALYIERLVEEEEERIEKGEV